MTAVRQASAVTSLSAECTNFGALPRRWRNLYISHRQCKGYSPADSLEVIYSPYEVGTLRYESIRATVQLMGQILGAMKGGNNIRVVKVLRL